MFFLLLDKVKVNENQNKTYFLSCSMLHHVSVTYLNLYVCIGTEAGPPKPHGEGGRPAAHRGADPAAAQHAMCGPASHCAGRRGEASTIAPIVSVVNTNP